MGEAALDVRHSAQMAAAAHPERRAAESAGLRYVSDTMPGIRRRRAGQGFVYVTPAGRLVRDRVDLARIRAIVIPPAWTDVWICARADGHLQAVGRDARGRKQYRYHARWRAVRDRTKYDRMLDFARALPRIRRRVRRDMRRPGLSREKVLATVVQLLEATQIRVGNEEYARSNRSYGLTTLRDRHVEVSATRLRFRFRGKSGKLREVEISDRRLARIVRRCQEIPGQELFQYVDDDGRVRGVGSGDVNEYIRDVSGADFTAKDFRTWAGTVLACAALRGLERARTKHGVRKNVTRAVAQVAERLGNTPAVCRKAYIHPRLLDRYVEMQEDGLIAGPGPAAAGLRSDEASVVRLLREQPASRSAL